ncbi:hypothetical protein ACIO02_22855 [Streptomyces sp. NPDC087568]|uniref:hypothetical protein n=1 Tax=Streptomyces sp. NPDC087568 TaxID=3365799 RepID=UPI00382D05CD
MVPQLGVSPVEESQTRASTTVKRHPGEQRADVDALPGPQHGEALPHVVRTQGAFGVELAEQQRVIQLPAHLHAPCEQRGPDPALESFGEQVPAVEATAVVHHEHRRGDVDGRQSDSTTAATSAPDRARPARRPGERG